MGKILILANNDNGLYKFRKELIQELINKGNYIYISVPNGEMIQPLIDIGCVFIDTDIDRRGINPITDFKLILNYFKIITKTKPDMLLTYTVKPNIYGGIVARFKNISYAINITGLGTAFQNEGFLKKLIVFLYRVSCKKAKVIFFYNEENQNIFINNKISSKEKTCKWNGAGVDLDEYSFAEFPEENSETRFLFIGRVMKEKGVDELLEVAEKIKSQYQNVYFDIVGPEEESYVGKLKELHDNKVINYYGFQKDVKPFIKNAHCFVLPSYHEGMANTLLECGAMGRPLITSDIPGCREAVIDGVNGYLTEVKDSNHLYNNICKFIELSYEDKISMSNSSRRHIESKFSKLEVVRETVQALKSYCNI